MRAEVVSGGSRDFRCSRSHMDAGPADRAVYSRQGGWAGPGFVSQDVCHHISSVPHCWVLGPLICPAKCGSQLPDWGNLGRKIGEGGDRVRRQRAAQQLWKGLVVKDPVSR